MKRAMTRTTLRLADMALLPWPDEAQVAMFIQHLCWAHSWYKHLPFDESTRFVIFLARDAGAGFETRKREHYSWGLLQGLWEDQPRR